MGLPFFCLCLFFLFYYSISSKYVIYYPLCCIKIILNVILHILNKKFEKQKKKFICITVFLATVWYQMIHNSIIVCI